MRRIKVATWNIGGGILGESHQTHGLPNLTRHAAVLSECDPDIVCLQEAHIYATGVDQVATLATLCGYKYHVTREISPSHLAKDASLALGLLSKFPIVDQEYIEFPNPGYRNTGPNGEEWILFDKGFTTAKVEIGDGVLHVVNAHYFPFHYFNADPRDPRLTYVLDPLRDVLRQLEHSPAVACIDLNSPYIDELLPVALQIYQELIPRGSTTPKGVQQDYILGTRFARLLERLDPVQSHADHFMCMADIGLD